MGRFFNLWFLIVEVFGYNPSAPFFRSSEEALPATPPAMAGKGELSTQQLQAAQATAFQQAGVEALYSAGQTQWFEDQRSKKRGPPSTLGITSSGLTTPQEHQEQDDTEMRDAAPAASSAGAQASEDTKPLLQVFEIEAAAAYELTAIQAGVDVQNKEKYQQWAQGQITTSQQVLDTIRAYHTGVIRTEMRQLVFQIEGVVKKLNDAVLRQHDNLRWLTTESRQEQKRVCALQVLLNGFDTQMPAEERLFMINWMFEQIDYFRSYLKLRGFNLENPESSYVFLNVLQGDPATPPSGAAHSPITIITFKSWDLRQNFMQAFGGTLGTPLWRDNQTSVKGKFIRATPCSPQFQRKLEIPIRVLLSLINESEVLENSQVVVLWKTLTIMEPQASREFNPQARACARMHYYEQDGELRGYLETTPPVTKALLSKPPAGALEEDCWEHHWTRVVYGIQHEIDLADKDQFNKAMVLSKGTGRGVPVGKGKRHWSSAAVYSSSDNPYPLQVHVQDTAEICYVWDEYCDKFQKHELKVGSYEQGTFQGPPTIPAAAASAQATPQPNLSKAAAPAPKGTGRGVKGS